MGDKSKIEWTGGDGRPMRIRVAPYGATRIDVWDGPRFVDRIRYARRARRWIGRGGYLGGSLAAAVRKAVDLDRVARAKGAL